MSSDVRYNSFHLYFMDKTLLSTIEVKLEGNHISTLILCLAHLSLTKKYKEITYRLEGGLKSVACFLLQ